MTVVTFSREAHTGTRDLARQLAQQLGYRYVSRDELTSVVTARSGVHRRTRDQETEGRSLSLWEQLSEQLSGTRDAYIAALRAAVTELALADNVVIVGHGAGLFLADMRSVLRVFVIASVADRVARLQAEQGLDLSHARQSIERQDRESAEYLRYVFGVDWLDPHQWDLVINTGRSDPEAVLAMLVEYTRSLVRDQAETVDLQRQRLSTRIEQALIKADVGVDRLAVHFESSTLTLEGEALTLDDRERAESVARSLAPEAAIDNQISVRPPSSA